jgi:hypothetical protein
MRSFIYFVEYAPFKQPYEYFPNFEKYSSVPLSLLKKDMDTALRRNRVQSHK